MVKTQFCLLDIQLKGLRCDAFKLGGQPSPDFLKERVDRTRAEDKQRSRVPGWQIKGKEAQNLQELALRNLRPFVVPVFPFTSQG